jgi:hypothetical protein
MWAVAGLLLCAGRDAGAQFLRLGPFDFTGDLKLEGVYTTNVEGERESEAELEREDYYAVISLDLRSSTDMSPGTRLSIDTGVAYEKHANRPDLDNSENPFGRLRIDSLTEAGHWRLMAEVFYEREQDSEEVAGPSGGETRSYIPGTRKQYKVSENYGYGAGLEWKRDPFTAGATYDVESERYDDPTFQDGDQDETTAGYYGRWQFRKNMAVVYDRELTYTDRINDPENDPDWRETTTLSLDGYFTLIRRPHLTYSLGIEKEDTDEEEGEWDPKHTFSLSDEYHLTSTLDLRFLVSYSYEPDPEEDDVSFTYGVSLNHQISRTASQRFSADREPVDTFGSTAETDSTEFNYDFTKSDLLVRALSLRFHVGYAIDRPVDGPEERTWDYDITLDHRRAMSRRLERSLMYEYTWEKSDLITEILDEHRVTLAYIYHL